MYFTQERAAGSIIQEKTADTSVVWYFLGACFFWGFIFSSGGERRGRTSSSTAGLGCLRIAPVLLCYSGHHPINYSPYNLLMIKLTRYVLSPMFIRTTNYNNFLCSKKIKLIAVNSFIELVGRF